MDWAFLPQAELLKQRVPNSQRLSGVNAGNSPSPQIGEVSLVQLVFVQVPRAAEWIPSAVRRVHRPGHVLCAGEVRDGASGPGQTVGTAVSGSGPG